MPLESFNEIEDDALLRWAPGEVEVELDGGSRYCVRVPLSPMQVSGEPVAVYVWKEAAEVLEKLMDSEYRDAAIALDEGSADDHEVYTVIHVCRHAGDLLRHSIPE